VRLARALVGASLLAGAWLWQGHARADGASGASEQLFLDGRKLMAEGKTSEACAKFKASHEADKTATGTLLNLALCNEALGKTASAWAEFRQVAAESETAHRADRVALAREHEARLLAKLSYFTIHVRDDARAAALHIVVDGEREITPPMWDTRLPIDPGPHTVAVDAPGRVPASYPLTVSDAADSRAVDILPLAVDAVKDSDAKPVMIGSPGRRTAGYVIIGVGIAAIGVGATFGAIALAKSGAVSDACPNDRCPTADVRAAEKAHVDDAHSAALVADIALSAGAVIAIAGAVLAYTGRERPATRVGEVRVNAAPTVHGGALLLQGAF
jgi:hypothetical protein